MPPIDDSAAAPRQLPGASRPRADAVLLRVRPLHWAIVGVSLGLACGAGFIGLLAPAPHPSPHPAAATVAAAGRAESAPPSETLSPAAFVETRAVDASHAPERPEERAPAEAAREAPDAVEPNRPASGDKNNLKAQPPPPRAEPRRESADAGPGRSDAVRPERRGAGRCVLSLSAGSLSLRAGGSATITASVDDLGGGGRVTAATNHWADIAVFPETRGGGRVKYTVISVSRRPGSFAVGFKSRCGVKTIPVVVTRP